MKDKKIINGIIFGETPWERAKETLRLLREGNHEELKRRAEEAWERVLENARRQRYEEK